ncbi:MAG: energy-coupling factor transporter transmembrane protein EcfT [Deltaproteobacteria bacterium]|nr:energy-coupling factor transporter transmembrane protein EcfT [Deltaproteobacteria bacterium]
MHGEQAEGQNKAGLTGGADPRLKLAVLALWSVELALSPSLRPALLGLAGSLAFAWAAGALGDPSFYRRLAAVNGFLLFVWLLVPFSVPGAGAPAAMILGLEASREGVGLSALISVKAAGITMGALALTRGAPALRLLAAARALGAPEKAVALTLMTVRYIAVMGHEYSRLRNAMRVRGFSARISLHCLKSFANLAGMLLVRGIERAERVRAAMLCRGWQGRFWIRTGFRCRGRDLAFAALAFALSAVQAAAALAGPEALAGAAEALT